MHHLKHKLLKRKTGFRVKEFEHIFLRLCLSIGQLKGNRHGEKGI